MLLDEEPYFRATAALTLQEAGFDVYEEASASRALRRLVEGEKHAAGFDLFIINLDVATMLALRFLELLRKSRVKIPVLLITVFVQGGLLRDLQNIDRLKILVKPCRSDNLVDEVLTITGFNESYNRE